MENTQKRNTIKYICYVIMLVGFATRLIYAGRISYSYSTHDIGYLSTPAKQEFGHLAYIQYLYENHSFAPFCYGQFYHPPLFYIVGALVAALFRVKDNYVPAFETLQMLNMIASCLGTYFAFKIVERVCKEKFYLIAATLFLTFCPEFYIVGGELNNDCFCLLFQIMAVYFVMVWLDKPTTFNIIKLALCIDAAVLSKLSGLTIAAAIGACFIVRWIKQRKEWKKYLKQYIVFGSVCIPIGLSWSIYRYITLKIPFTYVMRLGNNIPQYIGDKVSVWDRLKFPYNMNLNYPYIDVDNPVFHCNIWTQMFYTMNFDENLILATTNSTSFFFYRLLFYSSVILYLILVVVLIIVMFKKAYTVEHKLLFGFNYLVLMVAFVRFALDYAHVCTMNSRYIVLTLILLIGGYGFYYSRHRKNYVLNYLIMGLITIQSISMLTLYMCWPRLQ